MMVEQVIEELERYGSYAEAAAPPIPIDQIGTSTQATTAAPVAHRVLVVRHRLGWPIALAVAALVLLLIGGVALVSRETGTPVVDSETPTTIAEATPTPMPTVTPSPVAPLVWNSINTGAFSMDGTVKAVSPTNNNWWAVGSATDTIAVWSSPDGLEWANVDSDTFGPGIASGVAEHTGRLVVGGYSGEEAAIWTSFDGETWTQVPQDDALFGSSSRINDVIVHYNYAFLAVGTDIWISPNGTDWTMTSLAGGTAYDVLEYDSGVLAGGAADNGTGAMMWLSEDLGTTWMQTEVNSRSDLFAQSEVRSIAVTESGFVAVGSVGSGVNERPAAWRSEDDSSWKLVWVGDDAGRMTSVANSGEQTVAVGWSASKGDGTVWLSGDDGATWIAYSDRLNVFGENQGTSTELNSIETAGEGIFLVAGTKSGSPAMWLGYAPDEPEQVDADGRPLVGWTCKARIDNGAVWEPGEWVEASGAYVAVGSGPMPALCLDLLDTHREPQAWKVEWEGVAPTLEVGLLLVFEKGIHGTVYAEREIADESGEWMTPVLQPDPTEPFTVVVMPHSFDEWTEITFTITPCTSSTCEN